MYEQDAGRLPSHGLAEQLSDSNEARGHVSLIDRRDGEDRVPRVQVVAALVLPAIGLIEAGLDTPSAASGSR